MKWLNRYLLEKTEIDRLNKTIRKICKKYKVNLPKTIEINTRLYAVDGSYTYWYINTDNILSDKISLAYKHYKKFGMDSLERVLKHELAHHINVIKNKSINHDKYFKELCLELNACLNSGLAKGKYTDLAYEGLETPYRWLYICPLCGYKTRSKKKLNNENWCKNCKVIKIKHFKIKKIKEYE